MSKPVLAACLALVCVGCSDRATVAGPEPDQPTMPGHVADTRGGAIVLSRDESVAVAANRSAGVVAVIRFDPAQGPIALAASSPFFLDTGEGSEPWAAVIGADDDTAYVVLRARGTVLKIAGLHGATPAIVENIAVGADPTALAISPSGAYLFVANSGEGTISVIRTDEFEELSLRFDLNAKLAESGALGNVTARPGLAHPRALAMTDDGDLDDTNEVLYATEFFSQPISGASTFTAAEVDTSRQGFVYTIPVSSMGFASSPVFSVHPVAQTGFQDAASSMTGCFPNQLYAAAVDGGRVVVTSMCASPRGPVGAKTADGTATNANFQTSVHPTLFALDRSGVEPGNFPPLVLTHTLDGLYLGDDPASPARMPLIPNDIAFERETDANGVRSAYVTAFGADAVFRLDFDGSGGFLGVGDANARFIDLRSASRGGTLPIGVVLSKAPTTPFALVLNDNSQNLSVIDRETNRIVAVHATTDQREGTRALALLGAPETHGRRLFATGLDAWSLQGQAWNSCESCHPDGQSDNVTWFFTRGPRKTISTAPTYDSSEPPQRRMLLWTANVDEIHDVEIITRTIAGGVGGMLWRYSSTPASDCRIVYDGVGCADTSPAGTCVLSGAGGNPCPTPKHTSTLRNGLNGSIAELTQGTSCEREAEACDHSAVADWDHIDAYIRSLGARQGPKVGLQPTDLDFGDVDAGITLFREGRCAACHGGPAWTISKVFYTPGAAENGALPYVGPDAGVLALLGGLRQTTYTVDSELLRGLNPPAQKGQGVASLRTWTPADDTEAEAKTFAYSNPAGDQINCVLRAVGTFPTQPVPDEANPMPPANTGGIVAPGAPPVFELRQDMTALALGATGFNIPSLLGLASGAPYFHAGNARTLEEVFDPAFRAHYQAIVPDFLDDSSTRADDVRALVSYLLSIDEATFVEEVPADLGFNPVLCPE